MGKLCGGALRVFARTKKTPVCGGSILVVSVSPESEPAGFSPPVQMPFGAPQGGADRLLMEEGNGCAGEEVSRDCGFLGFRLSAQAGFSISRISQERWKAPSLFKTQGAGDDSDSRAQFLRSVAT